MAYKNYTSDFKAKVVIEVLQGEKSLNEIVAHYNLNPNMVRTWKSEFIKNAGSVFESPKKAEKEARRREASQKRETERMLNALKKGDKVITIGGIHGVVSSVKENTVIVKVDDDCKIEFNRTAISTVELSDEEKAKLAQAQAAKKSKGFFKSKKSEDKIESEKTSDKE